jgi:hypothetical protein
VRLRALRLNRWRRAPGNLQSGAGHPFDCAQRTSLRGVAKRYGDAARTSARRAADAVHIVLRLRREIEVDDVGDTCHVDPACREVGCHQHARPARAELLEGLLPRRLTLVAV